MPKNPTLEQRVQWHREHRKHCACRGTPAKIREEFARRLAMTRILMTGSALFLTVPGLLGTFAPDELLAWLGAPGISILLLTVQVLGAAFLGFAALNWMARENLVCGIYSRPA